MAVKSALNRHKITKIQLDMYIFAAIKSNVMAEHNNIGRWGENIAVEHMVKLGFAIVDRNVKVGKYELDIVATRGNAVAFVEVKTRTDDFVDPVDAIDRKKITHMAKAANAYVRMHQLEFEPQFDIITIIGTPEGEYRLEHYPDAFMPPLVTQ